MTGVPHIDDDVTHVDDDVIWDKAAGPSIATAIKQGNGFIEISGLNADLDLAGRFPLGFNVAWMMFSSPSAGEKISVKDRSAAGPEIFPSRQIESQGQPIILRFRGSRVRPFLDFSASTITDQDSKLLIYFG